MTKITLEAISDPEVQITGWVTREIETWWGLRLADGVEDNRFLKTEWRIVPPPLPTALGTVFRATVDKQPNVRVMVADTSESPYWVTMPDYQDWYSAYEIDPSTVVIELEGVENNG